MSSYARQFLNQMERPQVDLIEGLSPTISIDQKSAGRNPRSTVGTITEIYDFLRLLFSRLGVPQCPNGHGAIEGQTPEVMVDHIARDFGDSWAFVLAPIVQERKGEYRKELDLLKEQGFSRVRIDGQIRKLNEEIALERYEKHTIEVAFDYFEIAASNRSRLDEAVHKALNHTGGILSVQAYQRETEDLGLYKIYTKNNACPVCGLSIPELEPRLFSFNSPQGWCEHCQGLGHTRRFIPERLVKDPQSTIFAGALHTLNDEGNIIYTNWGRKEITGIAKAWKVKLNTQWQNMPKDFQKRILAGDKKERDGIDFAIIEGLEFLCSKHNMSVLDKYLDMSPCLHCQGKKLNDLALNVKIRGVGIADLAARQVKDAKAYFNDFALNEREKPIGEPILKEIRERLSFLSSVGLDYLSLDRKANTLSGGEAQRIRLASQVGSGLEGCLYILDEPSIGLHQADNKKLIDTLKHLRDKSNTVFVIEHDEDTILAADHVVDIGPGAGVKGGEVLFNDSPRRFYSQMKKEEPSAHEEPSPSTGSGTGGEPSPQRLPSVVEARSGTGGEPSAHGKFSHTIAFLSGRTLGESRDPRPLNFDKSIHILGAKKHNLKNIDLNIPLGSLTVVCGVSGSGKSTLISDILKRALSGEAPEKNAASSVKVVGDCDKFIEIDQKPIGRTPRSNPATYTKALNFVRDLFAMTPEAKFRGYKKGRFSFNVKGGRCENCGGTGVIEVDMQLFSANEVSCEVCVTAGDLIKTPWTFTIREKTFLTFWRCLLKRRPSFIRTSPA